MREQHAAEGSDSGHVAGRGPNDAGHVEYPLGAGPYRVLGSAENREHWLGMRKTMLTASDVAAVLGFSKYGNAKRVAKEKLYGSSFKGNLATFFGQEMEKPNMRAFQKLTGVRCRPMNVLLQSAITPELGCTLDGLGLMPNDLDQLLDSGLLPQSQENALVNMWELVSHGYPRGYGRLGIVEMKNKRAKFLSDWSGALPPEDMWIQAQIQLYVTGLEFGFLVAKIDSCDMRAHFIERDDFFCEDAAQKAAHFIQNMEAYL